MTDSDQETAKWILSCPISLRSGIPDHLLDIMISTSFGEKLQSMGQQSPRHASLDCLKHIQHILEDHPTAAISTPSSSSGIDYDVITIDDIKDKFTTMNWQKEARNMMTTCNDLIAVSCRLSNQILAATSNSSKSLESKTTRQLSRCDGDEMIDKEPLPKTGPISCNRPDYTLPDEFGANGFDYILEEIVQHGWRNKLNICPVENTEIFEANLSGLYRKTLKTPLWDYFYVA